MTPDQQARQPVTVRIEELVLHGFSPGDRQRIGAEVERELARLIGEGNLPRVREAVLLDRIAGGAIQIKAGAKARQTAAQIAQSVYRTLRHHVRLPASARLRQQGAGGRSR